MERRAITGAAAIAVALCACGQGDQPVAGWESFDSAGVSIVVSHAPAWSADEAWQVGLPRLVIGDEAVELFDVAGAVRRSNGGIVVADGGTSRLLFFDAAGELVGEAGGEGDGPGEFRIIQSLGLGAADEAWVYDFSHRSLSFFDARWGCT